jgi:pimeloyl-ACP methyl ester carboxylesterase
MPFTNNDGVRIYYEVEGSGPALLLAHGLGSSGEDWRELGYAEQLSDRYRVIMVDGRGHGKSDKPHDPLAYSAAERVKDHIAVLDDLGIEKANYWGYSSGGVVGFYAAKYAPDRFSKVIIGGLDPYPSDHDIGERNALTNKPMQGLPEADDPIRAVLDTGGEAWLRFWQSNMDVPHGMRNRLRRSDCQALIALWEQPYPWRDEVLPLLESYPFPCLLYVGEAEWNYTGMKVCAAEMPQAQFVALPNYGHFDIWANAGTILPYVKSFLAEGVDQ